MRFPLAIVREIKDKVGENFIIIFRLSMMDLVEDGSTWQEVVLLAKELEKSGRFDRLLFRERGTPQIQICSICC